MNFGMAFVDGGKINRCYDDYDNLLPLEKIPSDAFFDKSALKSITDKEVYDLSPTWENLRPADG